MMKYIILTLLLLTSIIARSQEFKVVDGDTLEVVGTKVDSTKIKIEAAFGKSEHIVIQHDKLMGCFLGDTIHFIAGIDKNPVSRIIYVELLHPSGGVIQSKKLKLDADNKAQGEIVVDTLYGSGFYELRAYTRHQYNFKTQRSQTSVIPVFRHASDFDKKENDKYRYISPYVYFGGYMQDIFEKTEMTLPLQFQILMDRMSRSSVQPNEKQLMVFGQVTNIMQDEKQQVSVEGKEFTIAITKGNEGISGKVQTDKNGFFMLGFPDTLRGDWNLTMYEKRTKQRGVFVTDQMKKLRVEFLENFAPLPYQFKSEDIQPSTYGYRKWKKDTYQGEYINQFIECQRSVIRQHNEGSAASNFYSWLGERDHNITRAKGITSPTIMNVARDTTYSRFLDVNFPNEKDSDDPRTVCVNGLGYDTRPIVWIVDGKYRMVTGLNKLITDFKCLRPSTRPMPLYLDEVSSVYITDRPDAFYSYVRCSVLEKKKPVTIFVTTNPICNWNDSALMSGRFRGYDN